MNNTINTNTNETVSEQYKLLVAVKTGTPEERKYALGEFWKLYQPLIKKSKGKLLSIAKENHISKDYVAPLLEDYEYGFCEDFMNAVNTQDLQRLDHLKSTWTLHYTMDGYLKRYNTKLIGHSVKLHSNEVSGDRIYANTNSSEEDGVSLFDTYEDNSYNPETIYEHNEESRILKIAIKKAYNRFNDVQKSIWEASIKNVNDNTMKIFERDGYKNSTTKRVNAKKNEVSESLSMSTKDLNSNLKEMKQIVSSEIRRANKKYNAFVVW